MKTVKELNDEIQAKGARLAKFFEEAGESLDMDKVKVFEGDSSAKTAAFRALNAELGDLGKERETAQEIEEARKTNDARMKGYNAPAPMKHSGDTKSGEHPAIKSIGEMLRESKSYEDFRAKGKGTVVFALGELETKTLLTLGDITPQATRLQIVPMAQEERTIRDLMLPGTMDGNTLEYYEETTFTNAAAETAEGDSKPESALDFTLRSDAARKIATWLPATAELLQDVSGLQSTIEERLRFMVRRREELELLRGDGIAPNIEGVQIRTGVQTQAKGADPTPDAIYKGLNKVRNTGFAEPTAVVFHPNDWMEIRLLRTADGLYIWGSPAEAGPERIWGLPIRQTTAQSEGTALVGAFRPHAQVFQRSGIEITISTEHSTYFVENKVAILAEERLALAVYRPAAFCKVTGI